MIPDPFVRERHGSDRLVEGYYLIDLTRSDRVGIPVHVWFGPPLDPWTGEEMDRSPRWQVDVAGCVLQDQPVHVGPLRIQDLSDIWPACAKSPIDETDWQYRMERADWASLYDETDPFGRPGGKIDPMTAPLP